MIINNKEISAKKLEIINAVYKSKYGLTSNELLEYLNELVSLCFHCEQPKKFEQIVKHKVGVKESYKLHELTESANIFAEQTGDQYYQLFTRPLKQLKPLEDLWRKEKSPDKFCIPDATKFYKWITKKVLANEWVSIAETNQYPEENETVWMYNDKDKTIWLGCYVYIENEGWFWAISNGEIYAQDGKIITEAESDDDYEITHWCDVPKLPKL